MGLGVASYRIGVVLVFPDCLHPLQRTRDVRSGAKSLFDKNAAADGQHGLFPPLEGSGLISRTGGVQEQPVSRTFPSNTVSSLGGFAYVGLCRVIRQDDPLARREIGSAHG